MWSMLAEQFVPSRCPKAVWSHLKYLETKEQIEVSVLDQVPCSSYPVLSESPLVLKSCSTMFILFSPRLQPLAVKRGRTQRLFIAVGKHCDNYGRTMKPQVKRLKLRLASNNAANTEKSVVYISTSLFFCLSTCEQIFLRSMISQAIPHKETLLVENTQKQSSVATRRCH